MEENEKIIIKIPLLTRSKKNSLQILTNSKTGRPFVAQSKLYKEFEKQCWNYLYKYQLNIDYPVNLKCIFYTPDRRKRDLVNLLNSIQDVLVKCRVISDDNSNIVQSVDGSRIIYRKDEPETIIEITRIKGE